MSTVFTTIATVGTYHLTVLKVNKLLLMNAPSLKVLPVARVLEARSLPAKSTRFSMHTRVAPVTPTYGDDTKIIHYLRLRNEYKITG